MDVELEPAQPEAVVAAVDGLLEIVREPDPWWQAGIDEALEP